MRRLITAGSAVLVATGVVLVLPVASPPTPAPEPVETSVTEVALGSVAEPAEDVVVEDRVTDPSSPAADPRAATPTLRVSRPDVADFSLVGVTWAYDPAVVDVTVRVRTRTGGGTWGDWTEIGVEDTARDTGGAAAQRGGTSPLWTGESDGVEVEVATPSGASPVDVRLDLVDPGTSPADEVPGTPDIQDAADAAEAMPDVYSRAQWGADERLRTWKPQYAGVLKAATIHHTAGANGYTAGEVAGILRGIYHYHAASLGWGDIGYNVLVDRFGRLWEGRSGGLASTVIGAHAGGFNTGTFGVSMIGNYDVVDTTPAMVDAIAAIVGWKLSLYGVNPRGTTTLTSSGGGTSRYAAGEKVTLPTVFAHTQVGATACPGRYGVAAMDEIRDKVASGYVDVTRITARYDSDAAARAVLGSVVTPPARTAGGTGAYASYVGGDLYYSTATGVQLVRDHVLDFWRVTGAERGALGFPVADVAAVGGPGLTGRFQRGSIWWSEATGARAVLGEIERLWKATGAQRGVLGFPTHSVSWLPDGVGQYGTFQGGSIWWSPRTGARVMLGEIGRFWRASGAERGVLGYPTKSVSWLPDGVGQYATFEHGAVWWSPRTGARAVLGPIQDLWVSGGAEAGVLGYPTHSVSWLPDGVGQYATFQGGSIWWSPQTGARALLGPIEDAWRAAGAETGELGYPTQSVSTAADGVSQYAHFQHGSLWTGGSTVLELGREVRDAWIANGLDRGRLGAPTTGETAVGDGRGVQVTFVGGTVIRTPETGTRVLSGPIEDRWAGEGGAAGTFGLPADDVRATADGRGEVGRFENGTVYSSPTTGVRLVRGAVGEFYAELGAERSVLGLPVADVVATADGAGEVGRFEGGSIWWSQQTGARAMLGAIEGLWISGGAERGPLGYPTRSVTWLPGQAGQYARFQQGSIWWTPRTGARALLGEIETRWKAAGAQSGSLGYPTRSVSWSADREGQFALFQGGGVWWSPGTGAQVLSGSFLTTYRRAGAERGALGYPTSEAYAVNGGFWQDFQNGTIRRSTATGRTWIDLR